MIQFFCDRCGAKLNPGEPSGYVKTNQGTSYIIIIKKGNDMGKSIDLCHKCKLKIAEFLSSPCDREETDVDKEEQEFREWCESMEEV